MIIILDTYSEDSTKERKRTLLKFLLGNPKEQSILFNQIINNELIKYTKFMTESNNEFDDYNKHLNKIIYNSKIKEINFQTTVLKEQIKAQHLGIKHPSILSIIERKLYIAELQIYIGVYNLLKQ